MKKLFLCVALISIISCNNKQEKKEVNDVTGLQTTIDTTLQLAKAQYEYMSTEVTSGRFPKTYHEDSDTFETSNSGWWCSGFYPGTMLYINEEYPSSILKEAIKSSLNDLKKEEFNTSTHDLGFMMYCSFGNAQQFEKEASYETILMNSAKSLATRYNDTVKAIRSWDSAPWNKASDDDLVVIIDNMMNLELLFWASEHSGDQKYYDIAVNHGNITMAHHFRPDYSSYHEVIYDEHTGDVKAQITNQGAADDSSWARGQGWGLYGYTVMYRATKNPKYLAQAQHIADYILHHPNLPKDKIPYWDFNAPNIPNALRDSSAASLIASALIELSSYSNEEKSKEYMANATTILTNLLSPKYLAKVGENGGFLLKHGVGNMPNHTEINTPLTYGDYYLVEAMIRYKNKV
ncbi:glucuronyl hydrolase [Neptunitalea chrysea]|uniref:Glucuronyl hydrolase n=1 Tax=Neptunitalea chrysea TaxID=1647581 RepID=A0A9W6B5V9_9FLAO|nr:glycoside hydrolase family 88 protein [Neptunitalea chrysea]GLB51268.1 glucuronyl hydrolase [Neptunitalea chrysea]